jgi:hypothetical protein
VEADAPSAREPGKQGGPHKAPAWRPNGQQASTATRCNLGCIVLRVGSVRVGRSQRSTRGATGAAKGSGLTDES